MEKTARETYIQTIIRCSVVISGSFCDVSGLKRVYLEAK